MRRTKAQSREAFATGGARIGESFLREIDGLIVLAFATPNIRGEQPIGRGRFSFVVLKESSNGFARGGEIVRLQSEVCFFAEIVRIQRSDGVELPPEFETINLTRARE